MNRSPLHVATCASLLLTAVHVSGCGEGNGAPGSVSAAGQSSAGSTATSGAPGQTAGSAGSLAAGAGAGASGFGGSPSPAAGGGAGSPGGAAGAPDVSSDGDGDRVVGPTYTPSPLLMDNLPDAAKGKQISFAMQSADSTIYPGIAGPYQRNVKVYVPAKYSSGTAAPFMVSQDAMGQDVLPPSLDNLIDMKKLPKLVLIFVDNGGGNAVGSERGLEYDTVSGLFAEFIDKEVLPRVISEVKTQLKLDLTLTRDPEGRGTIGFSSGGSATFSMAWWHPDLFRRVITFSGSFVDQVAAGSPFPHGCWVYHDVDPHFTRLSDAPQGLIVQRCESASSGLGISNPGPCDTPLTRAACLTVAGCSWVTDKNKPIRVWIESADRDLGANGGQVDPNGYRDWEQANQRMAAAFKLRGYHYHYDHALNAEHIDGKVIRQTLPDALLWVWRGYPIE